MAYFQTSLKSPKWYQSLGSMTSRTSKTIGLSVFSKIMEKVMYNQLLDFITKHNILHKYQFGLKKQHSTNHAVISLVEKLHNALDQGNIAITCFLDIKKMHLILIITVF